MYKGWYRATQHTPARRGRRCPLAGRPRARAGAPAAGHSRHRARARVAVGRPPRPDIQRGTAQDETIILGETRPVIVAGPTTTL